MQERVVRTPYLLTIQTLLYISLHTSDFITVYIHRLIHVDIHHYTQFNTDARTD